MEKIPPLIYSIELNVFKQLTVGICVSDRRIGVIGVSCPSWLLIEADAIVYISGLPDENLSVLAATSEDPDASIFCRQRPE